ncbi:uncharacterized protein [Panulirus ornatus]|uniref:uncharacterized protein isoform X2 n=1 Tax=Panulirus ornatus TaxID=150431 RepID=UPI003A83E527
MGLLDAGFGRRRPLSLLFVLVLSFPSRGLGNGATQVFENCCYGDDVVDHGQVAVNLPSCCRRQVCYDGHLVHQQVGHPGDVGCCEFDGLLYKDGARLAAQCMPLECKGGHWTLTDPIEDCCQHCYLYNDPHIKTFDGFHYDWHGTCNYTVTQTGFSANPEVGVFSDFVQCNGDASCLAHTTFRDNPHTVVTMTNDHVHLLHVNGDEFVVPVAGVHALRSSQGRHPVLVWQEKGCVFLLGSSKLVLQHCRHRLDVWAYPSHTDRLHGLCGHFNSYVDDEFTDRRGAFHSLHPRPRAFPESWRTREQSDHQCKLPCPHCYEETTEDPCRASPTERALYSRKCRKLLHPIIGRDAQLLPHVHNCIFDVCMMRQDGASDEDVDQWLVQVQILLQQNKIILARTLDGERPTTDQLPADTRCTSGSHFKIECNWCRCENGLTICTLIHCEPDYIHQFGEDACDDGSRWRVDNCNTCVCVRGGDVCSHNPCFDDGSSTTTTAIHKGGPKPERCLLEQDPGPCYGALPRFSYNDVTNECDLFIYGGCKGNENNFESRYECEKLCLAHTDAEYYKDEVCLLDKDSGPCLAHFDRYAYDRVSGKCDHFIYGGCQGNGNNFETLEECWEACGGFGHAGSAKPDKCLQNIDPGPCKGKLERFAYNQATSQCDMFYYGGCLGNDNNFQSLHECKETCASLL